MCYAYKYHDHPVTTHNSREKQRELEVEGHNDCINLVREF